MNWPNFFKRLSNGGAAPLLDQAVNIADRFIQTPAEREQFIKDAYAHEVQDRNSAREMGANKMAPEIISYFTILLAMFLGVALFTDLVKWENLTEVQKGLIQVFFGAVLARVNDIYNYWFGSSMGNDLKERKIK